MLVHGAENEHHKDSQAYPGVRVLIPYTFLTRTHVRVRERNVNGVNFKLSTETERSNLVSKNSVRVRNVEGFFSKWWCVDGIWCGCVSKT